MKRWMALLIIFALMGSVIAMISCSWEEFDEFMGSHYGCGCFWDCTKYAYESLSGNGEEYVTAGGDSFCDNCIETVWNCSCNVLCGFFCDDE